MLGTEPEAVKPFVERVREAAFECNVSKLFELNTSQEALDVAERQYCLDHLKNCLVSDKFIYGLPYFGWDSKVSLNCLAGGFNGDFYLTRDRLKQLMFYISNRLCFFDRSVFVIINVGEKYFKYEGLAFMLNSKICKVCMVIGGVWTGRFKVEIVNDTCLGFGGESFVSVYNSKFDLDALCAGEDVALQDLERRL